MTSISNRFFHFHLIYLPIPSSKGIFNSLLNARLLHFNIFIHEIIPFHESIFVEVLFFIKHIIFTECVKFLRFAYLGLIVPLG
jgi:hypothetical protein